MWYMEYLQNVQDPLSVKALHNTSCRISPTLVYEGESKNFRTGRLERELQIAQLSATRCSYIATLWVGLVSSAA